MECAFVQVERRPTEEELRAIYSEQYFTHQKYRDTKTLDIENARRLALMQKYLPQQGAAVLDAGCASGDFIRYAKHYYSFYGYDYSPEAIKLAKEKNPEIADRFWVSRDDNFADRNYQFDAISLWDVIEHIWDPVQACRAMFALLKPGGYLFFSSPKIDSLSASILRSRWHFMTPPEHLSFLSAQAVQSLAISIGAKVIERKSYGKSANVGFIFRKLRRKLPALVPEGLVQFVSAPPFSKLSLYVPTNDIQYVVLQKNA